MTTLFISLNYMVETFPTFVTSRVLGQTKALVLALSVVVFIKLFQR